jgi:hypothetical protein
LRLLPWLRWRQLARRTGRSIARWTGVICRAQQPRFFEFIGRQADRREAQAGALRDIE